MKLGLAESAKLLLRASTTIALLIGGIGVGEMSFVTPATARIGRPLTPVSYAGVARRTTYRVAVRATTPVVVVPPPVVVVPPTCYDTVDVYGRVTRVCQTPAR